MLQKNTLQRLKEQALKRLNKEDLKSIPTTEKIRELELEIKKIIKTSPSKNQVQISQIKELISDIQEKRPSLEFAQRDQHLIQLKRKIENLNRRSKSNQISSLLWSTRQAKNRALSGDWWGSQEAFCCIRDAYQKLRSKKENKYS